MLKVLMYVKLYHKDTVNMLYFYTVYKNIILDSEKKKKCCKPSAWQQCKRPFIWVY